MESVITKIVKIKGFRTVVVDICGRTTNRFIDYWEI
jgi:hypothetical protein